MDIRGINTPSSSGNSSGASRSGASDFGDILKATVETVNDGFSSINEQDHLGLDALHHLEKDLFNKLSPKGRESRAAYGATNIF
jgi:hypothetical protein